LGVVEGRGIWREGRRLYELPVRAWRRRKMIANFCSRFGTVLFQLKARFLADDGQDLVEYALIVAILSFCAIAAEQNIATSISGAFSNVAATFNSDV
jgi:Flp pilus assembly pilin Flp